VALLDWGYVVLAATLVQAAALALAQFGVFTDGDGLAHAP
jgi:hypothetical protein